MSLPAEEDDSTMQAFATALAETPPPPRGPAVPRARFGALAWFVAATTARPDLLHGSLSLLNQAVVSGTSFATTVIVGRPISKDEVGVFYLVLTLVYLAKGIQEQLISSPYVVYCQNRRDEAQASYSGSTLLHQLLLTVAMSIVLLAVLGFVSLGVGPPGLAPALWVLLGALPFLQLREFIRRLAMAHLHLVTAMAIDVSVAVFQIGGLLLLWYFGRLTVPVAYGVMGAACALACGGWYLAGRQPLRFAWPAAVGDWWHNWGFARWALASHLIGYAVPYAMPWIVTAARGSGEAGALAACITVVGVASMFITGLASFLMPRAAMSFSHGGVAPLRKVLRGAAAIYASAVGVFAVFIFCTGDFLLVLAFGPKFAGYGTVLGILTLSQIALALGLTAGIGLCAIDRPRANLSADIGTLVVTLTIMLCLLQPLGVLGAALGDLGGKVVGTLVRFATLRRLLDHSSQHLEA